MTRKEEIERKAKIRADQYSHPVQWNDVYHGFISGAEWADATAWKPSDEQMEALEQFILEYKDIDDNNRAYPISHIIESLYNDLKKLKEE